MLNYVDDRGPGITRRKRGKSWAYIAPDGSRVTDADTIARLNRLAVPPAYRDCWFCPDPDGHLQATGLDARGRKQYRYHPDFRAQAEAAKYDRCAAFGEALPTMRAHVDKLLTQPWPTKERVLAAVVRLLDQGHIRVGNDCYARENESFGATTLRDGHARVRGEKLVLEYRGKHGKDHRVVLRDKVLARMVKRCQDLPGQDLFQFVGSDGAPHKVGSGDVNAFIKDVMGSDFSAKHFRTWGASVVALDTILDAGEPLTLKSLLEPVSKALGNTPAIARKSYVHPMLIEAVQADGGAALREPKRPRATKWLTATERLLLSLLGGRAQKAEEAGEAEAQAA